MPRQLLFDFSDTNQVRKNQPIPADLSAQIIEPTDSHLYCVKLLLRIGAHINRRGWIVRPHDRRLFVWESLFRIRWITIAKLMREGCLEWSPAGDSAHLPGRGH